MYKITSYNIHTLTTCSLILELRIYGYSVVLGETGETVYIIVYRKVHCSTAFLMSRNYYLFRHKYKYKVKGTY